MARAVVLWLWWWLLLQATAGNGPMRRRLLHGIGTEMRITQCDGALLSGRVSSPLPCLVERGGRAAVRCNFVPSSFAWCWPSNTPRAKNTQLLGASLMLPPWCRASLR
jgi:hypothetical protein